MKKTKKDHNGLEAQAEDTDVGTAGPSTLVGVLELTAAIYKRGRG